MGCRSLPFSVLLLSRSCRTDPPLQRRRQIGDERRSGTGIEPDVDAGSVAQQFPLFKPRLGGAKALQKKKLKKRQKAAEVL